MATQTIETYDNQGRLIHTDTVPEDPTITNARTLSDNADAALDSLRAYVALTSPTAAQTTATVKLLCRVAIALIRLVLRQLDDTN